MMRGGFHRACRCAGYTLLEMLIVLAILSTLAAFAWPALRRTLTKSQLRNAAKMVRVELARTRLKAIRTGIPQQFRYRLGSNIFETGPVWSDEGTTTAWTAPQDDAANPAAESESSTDRVSTTDRISTSEIMTSKKLPEGALFADPSATRLPTGSRAPDSTRSAETSAATDATDPFDEQLAESLERDALETSFDWSEPIVFYPNGRTTNARILLQGRRNFQVSVTLRGLTGSARVSQLKRSEEQQ